MLKKVNQDPFSNGTEHMWWTERNCDRCVKQNLTISFDTYREPKCAILRDIENRMFNDEPIALRTIDICSKADCPYRQEKWKQYPRKPKNKVKGLPMLNFEQS